MEEFFTGSATFPIWGASNLGTWIQQMPDSSRVCIAPWEGATPDARVRARPPDPLTLQFRCAKCLPDTVTLVHVEPRPERETLSSMSRLSIREDSVGASGAAQWPGSVGGDLSNAKDVALHSAQSPHLRHSQGWIPRGPASFSLTLGARCCALTRQRAFCGPHRGLETCNEPWSVLWSLDPVRSNRLHLGWHNDDPRRERKHADVAQLLPAGGGDWPSLRRLPRLSRRPERHGSQCKMRSGSDLLTDPAFGSLTWRAD